MTLVGNMTLESTLKSVPLFSELSQTSLSRIATACRQRNLAPTDFLFFQDQPGEQVFVLLQGTLRLQRSGPDGRDVVIKTVMPGELFAEVILFESPTYPVTAVALQECRLLSLRRSDFLSLLDEPSFRNEFIRSLFRKMRFMTGQMQSQLVEDVGQRLVQWLRQHFGPGHTLIVDLPKKEVAQALNITPETLSRTLLRLKNEGTLVWIRNQIVFGKES